MVAAIRSETVTNWDKVTKDALAAAKSALGAAWGAASQGATGQIGALVHVGRYIEENKDRMTAEEYTLLSSQQKVALQNVLTAYEAIGIATAQNAVAAVINAILKDVPSLVGSL
jgi:hypothetical protein